MIQVFVLTLFCLVHLCHRRASLGILPAPFFAIRSRQKVDWVPGLDAVQAVLKALVVGNAVVDVLHVFVDLIQPGTSQYHIVAFDCCSNVCLEQLAGSLPGAMCSARLLLVVDNRPEGTESRESKGSGRESYGTTLEAISHPRHRPRQGQLLARSQSSCTSLRRHRHPPANPRSRDATCP